MGTGADEVIDQLTAEVRAERIRREQSKLIVVRAHWNQANWLKVLAIPLDALSGFHWTRYSEGNPTVAPRPLLHAYVSCHVIPRGEDFAHECESGGRRPHRVKVCILPRDNPRIFDALAVLARQSTT
jgi:hypothetical protein